MAKRRPPAAAKSLWALFQQLDAELQRSIIELLSAGSIKNLRLACGSARALANSCVERIRLPAGAIVVPPLRLPERFPRLQRLELVDDSDDGAVTDSAFVDFAVGELARLSTSLTGLHLPGCKSLGSAAVAILQQCCPQLRQLDLQGTAVQSSAALQLLASLTRLTSLNLGSTGVSAGLAQLTSLKGLASLGLHGCAQITDEHLQPLSALTCLTQLDAASTGVQGSSLAALGSLRSLSLHACSRLGAASLADVAQLTRLTFLNISSSAKEAGPAQLAQLAQLTNLEKLLAMGHVIGGQAAALLLQLPSLGMLLADSVAVQQGQAASGSAVTRLVLMHSAATDLQALPQLPALQSMVICTARAGTMSSIRVQQQLTELVVGNFEDVQAGKSTITSSSMLHDESWDSFVCRIHSVSRCVRE